MTVTPLRKYFAPEYPTLQQAQTLNIFDRKSLSQMTKNKLIAGALIAAFLGTQAGCTIPVGPPPLDGDIVMDYPANYINKSDVINILLNEAENLGITFDDSAPEFDLYNFEADLYSGADNFAVCVQDKSTSYLFMNENNEALVNRKYFYEDIYAFSEIENAETQEKDKVFYVACSPDDLTDNDYHDYVYYTEDELRQAFTEFIDWLRAEAEVL